MATKFPFTEVIPFLQGLTPFLQIVLTGAVCLLTYQIARQQVRVARRQEDTSRSQFRLNLFDKRLEVFEAAMLFLALMVTKSTVTHEERIDFVRKTRAARFIFNKEADDYFIHLSKEAIAIQVGSYIVDLIGEGAPSEQSPKLLGARLMWFNEQLNELPKEFDEFLTVEAVPVPSKKRFSARFTYDP